MEDLHLIASIYDPCFMYIKKCMAIKNNSPDTAKSICCLQTQNTAFVCNQAFANMEKKMRHRFDSKPVVRLKNDKSIRFNGTT